MRTKNGNRATRSRALAILVVFVTGALLSPLAHYSWMFFGGMPSPDAVSANGHMHRMASTVDHGPVLSEKVPDAVYCEYSDLFGTFSTTVAHVQVVTPEPANADLPEVEPTSPADRQAPHRFFLRGPPSESA